MAQQTETEAEAETTTTEAAEAAPAPTPPPLKTEEEAVVGEAYGRIEGDWRVLCQKTLSGDDPCRMGQLLRDTAGNPVIEVEVTRFQGENAPDAVMIINTPVGTILTEGVTLTIDASKPAKVPFFYCDGQVCVSRVNLRDADATAFKRGNVTKVSIVPVTNPGQTVSVDMSLTGFTAAYDSLPRIAPPQ
jgi:invasion protein IalB